MTYSVVARDPESGAFGVAVQSHYFAVGGVVPWVEAGVGAVATQSFAHADWREFVRRLVNAGIIPDSPAIAEMTADPSS